MQFRIFARYIPNYTTPYQDDMPVKGDRVEHWEAEEVRPGIRKSVLKHIVILHEMLYSAEDAGVTFGGRAKVGQREIELLGHCCGEKGRRPDPKNVLGRSHRKSVRCVC
jgi:hypothetical protein